MGALTAIAARVTVLALTASMSAAQAPDSYARVRPVTGPVRDAGIYHAATSTWTRKASAASLGADIIYNNTYPSGFFMALSGDTFVKEGRVPSPTSPTNLGSRPGCRTSYTIDGFQIAYCTDRVAPGPFEIRFFESYVSCTSVTGVTPTAGIMVSGVPGAAGALTCWTVTIDLDGLEHVDLGGIRAILRLARSLKGGDRTLDFVRGGDAVRHSLEQAGMHDLFPFTPALHPHRGHHDETP